MFTGIVVAILTGMYYYISVYLIRPVLEKVENCDGPVKLLAIELLVFNFFFSMGTFLYGLLILGKAMSC